MTHWNDLVSFCKEMELMPEAVRKNTDKLAENIAKNNSLLKKKPEGEKYE